MKKTIYLLLALLNTTPSMAMFRLFLPDFSCIPTSLIIASTLVVGNKYDKKLSLDLHYALEQQDYTSAQKLINTPQVDVNAKVDYGTDSWYKGVTPLIMCCGQGDKSFNIAGALLDLNDIKVNLPSNNGTTPLDEIVYWIIKNKANYTYVKLWNMLVAKGVY